MRLKGQGFRGFLRKYSAKVCVFALVIVFASPLGGCRKLKNLFGVGDTIVNPEPGTAEEVVQLLLKASLDENSEKGWKAFEVLLHTQERSSRGAMSSCRRTYWPGFRRKAEFFLVEPSTFAYDILEDRSGEHEGYRKIFIRNIASDQSTPIPLKRDRNDGDAWRLAACSL